jgi:aspartyl protease family protein
MDPDTGARTLYLVLLGAFLLFFALRGGLALGRLIRTLAIWALIITGLALAYTVFVEESGGPTASVVVQGEEMVLTRARDGHFHATLEINGEPIRFIVDTGATDLVLSRDDAAAAGVDTAALVYLGRARTANGIVRTAPVTLQTVAFGDRVDSRVRATVSEGEMGVSLLGMTYLERFERIEIVGNEMRLIP